MKKQLLTIALSALCLGAKAETNITPDTTKEKHIIPAEVYGQFAEHLGSCIYGGIWVGEQSPIANVNGYRKDVLEALKALHVPVMRWPGGCFADNYHWRDGIGPQNERPRMVNTNWGGTVEDNSFGTHEFLNLCELLGCEPYVSANIGSGTVEEMAKWVEYMTSDDDSPLANLRRQNGREKAWKVKYFGVGNESWGCGGQMRPEYYSDEYRRYAEYCRSFSGNQLFKIASGASDYDFNWTEVLMKQIGNRMQGVSLHYYSVINWDNKGKATEFDDQQYYSFLAKCQDIEPIIQRHIGIMNEYDPENKIKLLVDEWGTWWEVEEGTNPGHLFQQNTMRDAMVAALSLNIFHRYTDRILMTNIAQVVNVLQAMILTRDEKMLLTPTYHIYRMYAPHQNAQHLPLSITSPVLTRQVALQANGTISEVELSKVSATASQKAGVTTISLVNIDLEKPETIRIPLHQLAAAKVVNAEILTAKKATAHNTFDQPNQVVPVAFKDYKVQKGELVLQMPAMSIITLQLQ